MDPTPQLIAALFAGAFTLLLLIADAVTGSIDARRVVDDDELDLITRGRRRDLIWSIAVTAVLAVLVAYSVHSIIRAALDALPTLALLALVAVATFAVGLIGAIAAVRRERPSYARIRRDLRDRTIVSIDPEELAEFDARLARADRVRERPVSTSTVLRIVGLLIVLIIANTLLVNAVVAGEGAVIAWSIVAIVLAIASCVLGFRAAEIRGAAMEAALEVQRDEVVALLERARIPARGRVPGLRDRVARALAILREQQR